MADDLFVQGVSMGRLARARGPFVSTFLVVGDAGPVVPDEVKRALAPLPAAVANRFFDAVSDAASRDEVEGLAVIAGSERADTFEFTEPIRGWLCRVGRYPSLGPVLEQHQLIASHAMVTVEDGAYGVTTFGSRAVPDARGRSLGVSGSLELVVEQLRFAPPRLLALAGSGGAIHDVSRQLGPALPQARISVYPTENLDDELDGLADRLVRDAAALAAEDVTHELGTYRAAAAEGLVAEGDAVMAALSRREVSAVIAHDDIEDDRSYAGDRLVDAVVATALAAGVRVTMIPDVDRRRGPASGIGAIIGRPDAESSAIVHRAEMSDAEAISSA